MTKNATEILEQKISEIKHSIDQDKIKIADLFLSVIKNSKLSFELNIDELKERFQTMEKMNEYANHIDKSRSLLSSLIETKEKITGSVD